MIHESVLIICACTDADECATGSDLCEQVCTNTVGSYTCGCWPGYSPTSNLLSCLGKYMSCIWHKETFPSSLWHCHVHAIRQDVCIPQSLPESQPNLWCTFYLFMTPFSCNQVHEYENYSAYYCHMITIAGPPEDVTFDMIDTTNMILMWGTPENDTSDGNILNYLISCASSGDRNFALTLTRPANANRLAMLQSLRPFTSYNCCVSVQTNTAVSPFSCVEEYTLEEG